MTEVIQNFSSIRFTHGALPFIADRIRFCELRHPFHMSVEVGAAHRRASSSHCVFVGVVAVAAGAFTLRQSLNRTVSARQALNRTASARRSRTRSVASATMYGGGSGVFVPATGRATGAVIFMHGLGDSGHGWAPAFPLQGLDYVHTVLPSADENPVSLNGGFRMPSWFDLKGLDEGAPDDEEGIAACVARVNRVIDEQVSSGIPEHRIVVAGFSQGGAVALTYGLKTERKIAGVVALSTWLPMRSHYPAALSGASKDFEFFMGHGTADQVVNFRFGQLSASAIQNLERKISFHQYPGLAHSAAPTEMEDVKDFIARVLPRE